MDLPAASQFPSPETDADADGGRRWSPSSINELLLETAPGLAMLEALFLTESVTVAARMCGVSQPTVTRAMVRWESIAGTPLFDRSRRNIQLTGPGRELAESAGTALEALRKVFSTNLVQPEAEFLAIGSLHSLGQAVLIELVAEHLNQSPSVPVRLAESSSAEICAGLRAGKFDLGVVDRPAELAGFDWHRLGKQSLSLVLPASHRSANDICVDLRDFRDHKFVALDRRFDGRFHSDRLCHEAGFAPNIVLESDEPARVRQYVGDGRGIAILPIDLSINPRVRYIHIDSDLAMREFGILVDARRNMLARTRKFVANVRTLEKRYPGWADLLDH